MSEEEEQLTGKFRGASHRSCNINFRLIKNVLIVFHNLRGYDSHLINCELDKFDLKVGVIPNGLEKYMAFFLNKNLLFIDSMKFMNSSFDKLVKNLSEKDFKYSVEEFGSENVELFKQKSAYPYEHIINFEKFNEEKLPAKKHLFSSIKK